MYYVLCALEALDYNNNYNIIPSPVCWAVIHSRAGGRMKAGGSWAGETVGGGETRNGGRVERGSGMKAGGRSGRTEGSSGEKEGEGGGREMRRWRNLEGDEEKSWWESDHARLPNTGLKMNEYSSVTDNMPVVQLCSARLHHTPYRQHDYIDPYFY